MKRFGLQIALFFVQYILKKHKNKYRNLISSYSFQLITYQRKLKIIANKIDKLKAKQRIIIQQLHGRTKPYS